METIVFILAAFVVGGLIGWLWQKQNSAPSKVTVHATVQIDYMSLLPGDEEEDEPKTKTKELKEIAVDSQAKGDDDVASLRQLLTDKDNVVKQCNVQEIQQLNKEMAELKNREVKRNAEIQYLRTKVEKSKNKAKEVKKSP